MLNAPYNVKVPSSAYPAASAAGIGNHSAIYVMNGRTATIGLRARL